MIFTADRGSSTFEIALPDRFVEFWKQKRGPDAVERMVRDFVGCSNFTEIAAWMGVSCERVRQIYRDRFANQLPAANGRERNHACTLERDLSKPAAPIAEEALARAIALGLRARRVISYRNDRLIVAGRRIRIEDHLCVVRHCRKSRTTSVFHTTARYFHFHRSRGRWDFLLAACGELESLLWFVLPNAEIPSHGIFLPANFGDRYWSPKAQFREAWHLLSPVAEQRAVNQ